MAGIERRCLAKCKDLLMPVWLEVQSTIRSAVENGMGARHVRIHEQCFGFGPRMFCVHETQDIEALRRGCKISYTWFGSVSCSLQHVAEAR